MVATQLFKTAGQARGGKPWADLLVARLCANANLRHLHDIGTVLMQPIARAIIRVEHCNHTIGADLSREFYAGLPSATSYKDVSMATRNMWPAINIY